MGKGRPRAVEKGVSGQSSSVCASGPLNIPSGPVYYPTEEEFENPLEFIYKIRPEAERYGICKIVPPSSWKPPFALDLDLFTFPTKTQAIHQLQVRPAASDSKTFELEYNRFLEDHCGRKPKKRVVFEGLELDLCKLFNAVKRYGGCDKVVKEKKWGEVFRFMWSGGKISECAKHVLCQLYREHLYDYESYYNQLSKERVRSCKRGMHGERKSDHVMDFASSKRRRTNNDIEKVKTRKIEKDEKLDQICEQCRSGLHGEVMLLCDRCNKGWHIYCLSPPLKRVPPGNWYCLECLNSDKDSFGFVPGKCFSLEAFKRMADRAKKKWFGSASASRVQIEKKFWEIVEGSAGDVEVMYGSDLDTSVYGSGFPRVNDERPHTVEAELWGKYCASPWNLNNLPKLRGSMLRAVHHSIAGVMVPWLYVGMLFSSFCWHFEDHCFYSMNYLHWGEPKCWYSVPGCEASAFEKVMRNNLPDLFEAQPDLLFQLVTMLNPSVLQENGVPVYSVLQEPGNFVITFPRSFHGGFNLGLNCAEAVNFAPADWLPHGGFGAELYQLYRKTAVLSHDELLCVVAKNDCDGKVTPYLKKELLRIYAKERNWRERLWRNGIINSSPMSQRKLPDFVGTEEDPTCIICHQYLYLSAVVCCCRPSAFACLEHWENICECKPNKLRLLYRYTLAELSNLVLNVDTSDFEEAPQIRNLLRQLPCSNESAALTKKVKGGHVSLAQLAEEWILHSNMIFQMPFSSNAFVCALEDAEQFLWAGSEMDPVRNMVKKLVDAQKWGEGLNDCISKVENWSSHQSHSSEKVHFEHVDKLLSINPMAFCEPGHLKLKDYVEEARVLVQEINYALSNCLEISELEMLNTRACGLPIYVKESEKLAEKISSAKVCIDGVRKCISEKCPAAIEFDFLHKLKSEILDLQVQLPEMEMLLDLLRKAESCRSQCNEILEGSVSLKKVEVHVREMDGFTVNVPELKLLRKYHSDAAAWISRFSNVIENVQEREDQENVVDELNCIMKDGALLRIQVDELPLVEVELKKAHCRANALEARSTRMTMDFLRQLMTEAVALKIEGERLFIDISLVLAAALDWEERAIYILARGCQMSDFEDLIRTSDDIFVVLPSLDHVKDAVSVAKSWLKNSRPFLVTTPVSSSLLKVEALKELVLQSKDLKISLGELETLQTVLQNCMDWEHDCQSLLQDVECLFKLNVDGNEVANGLTLKIEGLVTAVESITKSGLSLGFEFDEIPELRNACSSLQWCYTVLSFCSVFPPLEEVKRLKEVAELLPVTWRSGALSGSLIDGVKWLSRALELVILTCKHGRCKLTDAEDLHAEHLMLKISFPVVAGQLVDAIGNHKTWLEQVRLFFDMESCERTWSLLIQLKELGMADAFDCSELDMVVSEVEKVDKWKQHCEDLVSLRVTDANPLLNALLEIRDSLDRALYVYDKSRGRKSRDLCLCHSTNFDMQEFLTCSTCKDCFHLQCLGLSLAVVNDVKEHVCPYCQFIESGSVPRNGGTLRKYKAKRPELKMLTDLLSGAKDFFIWIEEIEVLQQVVEKTLVCRTSLMEIVDFGLSYIDRDTNMISKRLVTALKAVDLAGVYDRQSNCKLELALTRNSWKVRVDKLLEGLQKPSIQQIQRHLKEGMTISVPPEDHFWQKLTEVKHIGMQWADTAMKVANDSGALGLDKVLELITEGESLPIHLEKELKLLRARSMLYCICRKPYDQRAMIACDQCDEWYHFDCISLSSAPEVYICPACRPLMDELSALPLEYQERLTSTKFGEPQTPSPRHIGMRRKIGKVKPSLEQNVLVATESGDISRSNGIDLLLWRNRKPFRRAAKKRVELDSLSPLFHIPQ